MPSTSESGRILGRYRISINILLLPTKMLPISTNNGLTVYCKCSFIHYKYVLIKIQKKVVRIMVSASFNAHTPPTKIHEHRDI